MEKEYAIQIGGAIWDGDAEPARFSSQDEAEFKLNCMKALDPHFPKIKRPKTRRIMVREVGPWQTLNQMEKHRKRPYIYLVQKLQPILPTAVCSYVTVMATTDAERCKRFVAKMIENNEAQYYLDGDPGEPQHGGHAALQFSRDFDDMYTNMLNGYLVGVKIRYPRDGEIIKPYEEME
jgi:hypothetical protein